MEDFAVLRKIKDRSKCFPRLCCLLCLAPPSNLLGICWDLSVEKGSLRPNGKGEQFLRPPTVRRAPEGSLLPVIPSLPALVRGALIQSGRGRSLPKLAFVAGLGV